MTPLAMFGLGVPELLIILAVLLLLFGGSRLAGLGKSSGRALKEFKEETRGIKADDTPTSTTPPQTTSPGPDTAAEWTTPSGSTATGPSPDSIQDPAAPDVRRDV